MISGPVAADESGSTRICGSVLDATAPDSTAYAGPDLATATTGPPSAGPDLHVENSTIVGKVRPSPMTFARFSTDERNGRVWIKAIRNIPAGEEITYDYCLYDGGEDEDAP